MRPLKLLKLFSAISLVPLGSLLAGAAQANVIFYEHDNFEGRSFQSSNRINNLQRGGFNDKASSVIVFNERWEICDDEQFRGRCVILRPGRYSSLSELNLNDRVSSARAVSRNSRISDDRYIPTPAPIYDNRRRQNERVYDAPVTDVRAVMGAGSQRCWIEREQAPQRTDDGRNVPGALLGAVLGGVLGHQIGGGRGNDLATAGGAVAGAVIGSNAGRNDYGSTTQDVRRCENVGQGRPAYWDVTYEWRGRVHHAQTTFAPGATLRVNAQGEPRA
jgi:uncharacterized protein YcfJ